MKAPYAALVFRYDPDNPASAETFATFALDVRSGEASAVKHHARDLGRRPVGCWHITPKVPA